jgi:hypothetical protein
MGVSDTEIRKREERILKNQWLKTFLNLKKDKNV